MANPLSLNETTLSHLHDNWGWLLAGGIVLILLGTVGLGMSFWFTLAGVVYFGVLLLFAGAVQGVQSVRGRRWRGILWHAFIALLYLLGGVLIVINPFAASVTLTLFIAWVLIVIGALRAGFAWQTRPTPGWGWSLAAAAAAIVLGILVLAQWPGSSFWFIGLFISVELIFNGWALVMLALSAKRHGGPGTSGTPVSS